MLVCLCTTLLSARIPALRAVKIDPISAIRQSNDVKLSGREVKTSRLTQKLFGFEGMPYYLVTVAISYMLSGYCGLYRAQKIMYSKTEARFINTTTH